MAFVVPAEVGHAPYAAPLLDYLVGHFSTVHIVAVNGKLFPELSEDCWLLYAAGFGGVSNEIRFSAVERFGRSVRPPRNFLRIAVREWRNDWGRRLRPYLLPSDARQLYRALAIRSDIPRLGDLASVGIGYVSGANDFFHLRPSEADRLGIPTQFLQATAVTVGPFLARD